MKSTSRPTRCSTSQGLARSGFTVFVTKIRLENLFWDILAELAGNEGMTTNQLIAKLYDEIEAYRGEVENFASFLRVTCLRYLTLRHQKTGERPSLAVVGTLPPAIRELPRSVQNA